MKGKDIKVVKRFYFQDGEHLYPEGGYDNIRTPLLNIPPYLFRVSLAKKVGLVTEDNEEILPLEYCFISDFFAKIQDKFYIKVAKRNEEKAYQESIVRLDNKNDKWTFTVVISCEGKQLGDLCDVGKDGWLLIKSKESSDKIGLVNIITGARIEPAYQTIGKFEHGLAPVGTITKEFDGREVGINMTYCEYLWGMIDEQGKLVVPMQYPNKEFENIKPKLISRYGKK